MRRLPPSNGKRRDRRPYIVAWLGVSALLAAIVTEIGRGWNHTLASNGRWTSTKVLIRPDGVGGDPYLWSRRALPDDQLDLSAWYGFQEVLYREPLRMREIRFDLLLARDAWAYLIFNKDAAGFSAIRLSANANYENLFVQATDMGRFSSRVKLDAATLTPEVRHAIRVDLDRDKGEVRLFVDERSAGNVAAPVLDRMNVGFRGDALQALVDNVLIRTRDPEATITEDFHSRTDRLRGFLVALASVLAVTYAIRPRRRRPEKVVLGMIIWAAVALPCAAEIYAADVFFAKRYPKYYWPRPSAVLNPARQSPRDPDAYEISKIPIRREEDPYVKLLRARQPMRPDPEVFRVLFLGTSQTYGIGVSRAEEAFVWLTEKRLNETPPLPAKRIQCVNGAIPGVETGDALEEYRSETIRLVPDLCILNFSINDRNGPRAFASNLKEFVRLNRALGVPTVFSLEAVPTVCALRQRFAMHDLMRRLARELDVPLWDLHGALCARYDEGFLWWDGAHLARFGQVVAAEFFADRIRAFIGEAAADPPRASTGRGLPRAPES